MSPSAEPQGTQGTERTLDAAEVERFERLSKAWVGPDGQVFASASDRPGPAFFHSRRASSPFPALRRRRAGVQGPSDFGRRLRRGDLFPSL